MKVNKLIDRVLNGFLGLAALVLVWIGIQVFVCSSFKIPSDSMEPELQAGDYIWVLKPVIGARLFNLSASLDNKQVPIYRIPGIRKVRRNDVLVFNFPYPNRKEKIEMHILRYYVKRCIGIPGDTLSIENGLYRIAGYKGPLGNLEAQKRIAERKSQSFPEGVFHNFPYDSLLHWNIKDFGKLYIPKAGDSIRMDRERFCLYRKLIEWEQKGTLQYRDSAVYLDGKPIEGYRFCKSYYFMGGDRCINSQDSRYWGLLPEEYIVGKAWMIWKSTDPYTGKYQWNRFCKLIH